MEEEEDDDLMEKVGMKMMGREWGR